MPRRAIPADVCRHLAYLGPPVDLASLLLAPPHSLLRQSYAPVDMRGGGAINVDGFGVGWYHPGSDVPVRYRRALPMWTDTSFVALAPTVRSGAVLAAVRSASPGMPVVETACAPFTAGPWLFSHNGRIIGWPGSVTALAARLPVADLLTLDAPTDAALLWALVRHRLRAGEPPDVVLAEVAAEVTAAAPGSRLNLLFTDGMVIVATTVHHALSVRHGGDGVLVASEPTDHGSGWEQVPQGHLLTASPATCTVAPIRIEEP